MMLMLALQLSCKGNKDIAQPKDNKEEVVEIPKDSSAIIDDGDPFKDYLFTVLKDKCPMSSHVSGAGSGMITTERMTFKSRDGINTVYVVIASPVKSGPHPGIFILHGGGGNADGLVGMAEQYAKAGYVAMTMDLPGICGTGNTPYSTGPWKSMPAGEAPRFDVAVDPAKSTLTDGLIAAMQGFNLLRSRSDVDKSHIGVTGFSWGGYTTTFLSSIMRDRVQAAYSIYGSGFYDKESFWTNLIAGLSEPARNNWLKYFDAGRRASFMTAPYFIEAASNDTYFRPKAVMATLNVIPGTKNQVWGPNLNHARVEGGGDMQMKYFDYHLKGKGEPFYSLEIVKSEYQLDQGKKIFIKAGNLNTAAIKSVTLYYSQSGPESPQREWKTAEAVLQADGLYIAVIPAEALVKEVNYYAFAIDSRGIKISSLMQ